MSPLDALAEQLEQDFFGDQDCPLCKGDSYLSIRCGNGDCRQREIAEQNAVEMLRKLQAALVAFAMPRREHDECEDPWYSCPKHPDYIGNDDREHCSCGADKHNEKLERHASALRDCGVGS